MALPSEKQLDRIVKGTVNPVQREDLGAESGEGLPPPYTAHNTQTQGYSPPPQAYSPPPQAYAQDHHSNPQPQAYPQAHPAHPLKTPRPYPPDPTSLLPSSPPQIYLNLLILEASLRSQYLTLRARRRQNTFVLTLLALWIAAFFYAIWLRPRDDGKGIGGSGYWIIDGVQKMCFITGIVTALLFWATGQWERGVRWPRRWIGVANRGLRGMNAKIVVMRGGWGSEILDWISFMVPFRGGLWGGEAGGSSYHFVNLRQEGRHDLSGGTPRHRIIEDGKEYAEEDIAPGGDLIKLLLLPKPFTPDFREGWEIYRAEYWERENERRGELRRRIRARQREVARQEGGLFWWTGWHWRRKNVSARASDVHSHPSLGHAHPQHLSAERTRRHSSLRGRASSRSSSRSSTPTPLPATQDPSLYPPSPSSLSHSRSQSNSNSNPNSQSRERRWSNSTAGSASSFSTRPQVRNSSRTSSINMGTGQGGGMSSAGLARQSAVRVGASSPVGSRSGTGTGTGIGEEGEGRE